MRIVAFPVSPLVCRSCGESQSWSFSRPRRRPRVVIRARCCAVVLFSDALVAKAGASQVCSGASSLWVTVFPSLYSSQGACARNSASSPHFSAVSCHDVLRWLLIGGKAFCGCSGCFIVVRCWSHPRSQYFPYSSFGVGSTPCSVPCTCQRAVFACSSPSPREWFRACKGRSPEHCPAASAGTCLCCARRGVAGVVRSYRDGDWARLTWIVSPAVPPPPCRSYAALGSLSCTRARRCPRVGICACCGVVVFPDVFVAGPGALPGRSGAASCCCILCVCQDVFLKAC